jgi:PHD/YefM family antitoxin component YafN of YafNO toxin-antitoxin module
VAGAAQRGISALRPPGTFHSLISALDLPLLGAARATLAGGLTIAQAVAEYGVSYGSITDCRRLLIWAPDAQRSFRSVLDRVEHRNEHVTIVRYKTRAAVLAPVSWYESAKAARAADGPGPDRNRETYADLNRSHIR